MHSLHKISPFSLLLHIVELLLSQPEQTGFTPSGIFAFLKTFLQKHAGKFFLFYKIVVIELKSNLAETCQGRQLKHQSDYLPKRRKTDGNTKLKILRYNVYIVVC